MMSNETSSEWLLRRKAELAAKDLNTRTRWKDKLADLHTEDKVAGFHTEDKVAGFHTEDKVAGLRTEDKVADLHTEDKVAGLHTEYKEEADKATNNGAEKVETQVVPALVETTKKRRS